MSEQKENLKTGQIPLECNRRDFIKSTAFVGGCAALASRFPWAMSMIKTEEASSVEPIGKYKLAEAENLIYSTCLQCHVACQVKAKIWDGTLAKLTGSPYSPQNYLPHLPFATALKEAAMHDGKLCAKGQTGIQTCYDPYRIRKVLKRAGDRGDNKWQAISFSRFINEVVKGGKLFSAIGDNRHYPGFDEVCALRDPNVAKAMATDAALVGKNEATIAAFKKKYAAHLDKLIDPDHPDLGPKNNQFIFQAGRIEHGRKELMKRFTQKSFGSVNCFEHTTICEQSHHIAYNEMTYDSKKKKGIHHMKPDLLNARFVLFWGTGAFTANFGLTPMAEKVTSGKVNKRLKTAVVDPRLSNDAGKADYWLPVKPGTDLALALAFIRWMIENHRFDERYLRNANKAAAKADGETTWSNASYLVKIVDGHPHELLRANEIWTGSNDEFVVSHNGKLLAVNPNDENKAVEGDLFVVAKIKDVECKTSLQLVRESAFERDFAQYEKETGIEKEKIAIVARELTSYGKKSVIEMYRGPVQHTDGYYAGCAIVTLNLMLGNPDWKGGLMKGGGHWHESGGKPGNVYNFKKMHPGALTPFGPPITREKKKYEDYTLFREQGYPAKRPWYPFSGNVYQEIIPSFAQGYPYAGKILFLHKGTPAFAAPAGDKVIEYLKDPEKVPLFIASDIVIGETSMYADYIVPDLTYLERWGTPHTTPDVPTKASKVRQPVIAPLTEETTVDGEKMPIGMEAFLIAVAKKLGISGFGKNAFGPGMHFHRSEDWFLKLIANLAVGDKPGEAVLDANEDEMKIFGKARKHLPKSVFDEEKWKSAVRPDLWRKSIYILNRGGRYQAFSKAYEGDHVHSRFGGMFNIFAERVAKQKNSINGKFFDGIPFYRGQRDAAGKPLERDGKYPFRLITFKEPFGGHSRTISNYWGNVALQNENKIWINSEDAIALKIHDNQLMRVLSAASPKGQVDLGNGRLVDIVGKVRVMEGIRPKTIGISCHYGHWAYGSNDVVVDGTSIRGDRRRAKGLCPNPAMLVDPNFPDVCLTDPVGASASFSDTRVALVTVPR